MVNSEWSNRRTIHHLPFTIYRPLAAGYILTGKTPRLWRCVTQRDELHSQIGDAAFEYLLLLGYEVAARFLFQHSQHINPVFAEFKIDFAFSSYGMLHHSQRSRSIGGNRHQKAGETCRIIGVR